MSKVAFVFPGQGAQYPGMGKELADRYAVSREVFESADRALGFPISRICFEGPEEELRLTENTQPALLTMSTAVFRILAERGIRPDFVAGHSLGEYSALVASGGLRFQDAVTIVRHRGRYMQEAVPVGVGAMAAVLGIELPQVQEICGHAAQGQVLSAANLNSANQIVVAGNREAVERAVELARQAGAKRSVMLAVSAPFHCALMKPAEQRLAEDLDRAAFTDLACPLVTNVDARPITTGDEAREALKRQVTRPVRWHETVRCLLDEGVRTFVELGPGRVLLGLIRSIDRSVTMLNVEDQKSLDAVLCGLL